MPDPLQEQPDQLDQQDHEDQAANQDHQPEEFSHESPQPTHEDRDRLQEIQAQMPAAGWFAKLAALRGIEAEDDGQRGRANGRGGRSAATAAPSGTGRRSPYPTEWDGR